MIYEKETKFQLESGKQNIEYSHMKFAIHKMNRNNGKVIPQRNDLKILERLDSKLTKSK